MNREHDKTYQTHLDWHAVSSVESLRTEGPREIVVGDRIIAVFANGAEFAAIDAVCAHQGGPLAKGKVEAGCVRCPWHGWTYRLADGFNTILNKPMLQCYPTRVTEDTVQVGIARELTE